MKEEGLVVAGRGEEADGRSLQKLEVESRAPSGSCSFLPCDPAGLLQVFI
jgi:hypothetical protein